MVRRAGRARPTRGRIFGWPLLTGAALCAALTGGLISPVWAAAPPDAGASDVELGSFSLGDALEATIGELDGSFGLALSAGGLRLGWDSRAVAEDQAHLGHGWSFGLATVRVSGGAWVMPPSGGAFQMDATAPSGLAGYPRADVSFAAAEPGATLPARRDGSVAETPYAYVLHELGGISTYFDAAGHPVAKVVVDGDRVDWRWEAGATGRLLAVVGVDGAVTELDWADPSRLVIAPGRNITDPPSGSGAGGRWEVELDGGRISAIVDPAGLRTRVVYSRAGLLERVTTPAGSSTHIHWQAWPDGVSRVDRVRSIDDVSGAEVSVRHWALQGQVSPTGWPASAGSVASASEMLAYETSVSDGKTRSTTAVDAAGRVTARELEVTTSSGARVIHEQVFGYPEDDSSAVTPRGARPTSVTTTQHDRLGATRSDTESYEFDELGRMTATTDVAGNRTEYAYDAVDGALSAVTQRDRDGVPLGGVRYGRDGFGRVNLLERENGVRTEYTFTSAAQVAGEVTTGPDGVRSAREYTYGPTGTLSSRIDRVSGDAGQLHATRTDYDYDALDRLVAQVTSDGARIDTTYWADGSRREAATSAGSTRFYWDGDRLLNDVHATAAGATGTASYLIGSTRHARSIRPDGGAPSTSYYGTDRHGNVTDLTDDAGTVTTEYAYTDYGVPTVTGDRSTPLPGGVGELGYNPFQYAGEYTWRDGTQSLGPRTYDALQARFLSEDETPLANRYAFVDLNPIMGVDPSGRMREADHFRLGLAIGGFVASVIGAILFFWAGPAFTVLGALGSVTAGGDVVFAAFDLLNVTSTVQFMDPKATEIASWSLFAVGLGFAVGGAIAKIATHLPERAATRNAVRSAIEPVSDTSSSTSSSTSIDDLGRHGGMAEFYAAQKKATQPQIGVDELPKPEKPVSNPAGASKSENVASSASREPDDALEEDPAEEMLAQVRALQGENQQMLNGLNVIDVDGLSAFKTTNISASKRVALAVTDLKKAKELLATSVDLQTTPATEPIHQSLQVVTELGTQADGYLLNSQRTLKSAAAHVRATGGDPAPLNAARKQIRAVLGDGDDATELSSSTSSEF